MVEGSHGIPGLYREISNATLWKFDVIHSTDRRTNRIRICDVSNQWLKRRKHWMTSFIRIYFRVENSQIRTRNNLLARMILGIEKNTFYHFC